MKKILFAVAIALAAVSGRSEADGYIMLSVWSPGELPGPSSAIHGGRLTFFYGECRELYGLDIGLLGANYVRERMYGFQCSAIFNYVDNGAGYQWGFANIAEHEFYGLQRGAWNSAEMIDGVQCGHVNTAGFVDGCQFSGILNWADDIAGLQVSHGWNHAGDGAGMQWAPVNTANRFAGFQLGVFNWANELDGLQLGFINVVAHQTVPVLPFLNIGFGW